MKISYNWLKDYVSGKMPSPKKLAELFTYHSFEIEGLYKKGNDWILDIDVLPNRAHDCFSHMGIAKEAAILSGLKFKTPIIKLKESNLKPANFVKVKVENNNDCPRYNAKIITKVKVGKSPKWISDRLKVCGLKPINNIVDITNYVMLETGQPMHAFDLDTLDKEIIVRRAKQGETIKTLDDKSYKLDNDILVIADSEKPVAVAGIKGGEQTGISAKTKTIIVEAANFNQGVIRKGSKKLKLRTDASARFENSIDPNLIDYAQQRAASLIQQYAGGEPIKGSIDFYPNKRKPKTIKLDLNYVNDLLGVIISKAKAISILKSLDFECKEIDGFLIVQVPTKRLDVNIQEDLIEEIGRIYGYYNIVSEFPKASIMPFERDKEFDIGYKIKNLLKELGYTETYSYSFIGEPEKKSFNFKQEQLAEIANPMSSFNKYLRPSLIPHLLRAVKENFRFFDEVRIFEIGKIFQGPKALEKNVLTIVLGRKDFQKQDFYELKGVGETMLNDLGANKTKYKISKIDNVLFFEIDFNEIVRNAKMLKRYKKIYDFPPVLRDLAVLVPKGIEFVLIEKSIKQSGGSLLKGIDLFEVYSGKGIPADKQNFAFHLIYQANRTLDSKEVDEIHQNIIKALEAHSEWQIRK